MICVLCYRAQEQYQEDSSLINEWAVCDGSVVYQLRRPWHIICFLLNIFLPGVGTIVSAFTTLHESPSSKRKCNFAVILDGILQQYLSFIIIGWVWSILFGHALYCKVSDETYQTQKQVKKHQHSQQQTQPSHSVHTKEQ